MSAEEEVRRASLQFYAGLNRMANGTAGAMADIWSHGPTVTTMHPIGGRQVGWDAVRGSFEQRVTNIYRREAGAWKIVHHHTDISPAMLETLSRLQSSSGQARR